MLEKGIISTNQFIWMLFIIITSVAFLQAPTLVVTYTERDAWLSVTGGWLLDVFLATVYAYMGIRFAGQNLVQYSITILGKYMGRLVGSIFVLFFLMVGILLQSAMTQVIISILLPRSPFVFIMTIMFIISSYAARNGIEIIARVSELLGPFYIFSIVLIGLIAIPNINIERLKPQLEHGLQPIMSGSLFMLCFYGICIIMTMFIPLCNKPENGFIAKVQAISLGAIFVGIVVIVSIGAFGLDFAQRAYAPIYQITRMLNIRIEIIFLLIAIGSGIIASAMMIWSFSLGISNIMGLSTYKPLIYPASIISLGLGLNFQNNVELLHYIQNTFPSVAIIVELVLVPILLIVAIALKKHG
ncbi:spore germination protein [Desulfofarcimen acetoxidans DSM 771]|uniref:Spore germination protein n=1 Tax=Desulfofarcimen acetoxidans (strain ATCC 49208 / DSM 771 / KCTC 5769 / VKM B-1644 / 5575) TaxID=485916 RepID=C8W1L9_DESAS|nr:endospore germination permease [Desulfofarcimen acetoxidans]ACV63490.1 spore germination protein [Desulfofarcimen acetoxidans DSM 771]